MKRYHTLLAGASWMAEYGNPDTDDWEFLQKYSPYHSTYKTMCFCVRQSGASLSHITSPLDIDPEADYPPILVTTSTRDDRVHPGHARKMAARMIEQGHDVLFYENIEGGHAGAADAAQAALMTTLAYSFLWKQLGLTAS